MDFSQPYASARSPVGGDNVVAASQPLAAQAGLRMLLAGGNAVDAAIATAMTLTVVEPTGCGIGSDGFAILWDGKELHGLNASGRAPAAWTPARFAAGMPERGWDAVTVPGAVSAWIALWRRFGSLPLETIAAPAIHYARNGHLVAPIIARVWEDGANLLAGQPGFAQAFMPGGRALKAGERVFMPDHAATLERIVASEGEAFYRGDLAETMVAHARAHGGAMTLDDLGNHKPDWVGTISTPYCGGSVHEIPPNGQGITTLITLRLLEALGVGDKPVDDIETVHLTIEATKLALADAERYVADRDAMTIDPNALLDPAYAAERAKLIDRTRAIDPKHGAPKPGGTVYLSAADASGMMISFIQSNYMGFGSGVVVPGTGISLQNRGMGFTLKPGHANEVGPNKRPFHTIIPGFALDGAGQPLLSFGVMGGPMQAQGHTQMAQRIMQYGQNPQAAADAPRWRVGAGRTVAVEAAMDPALVAGLRALGHDIIVEAPNDFFAFGGAQIIARTASGYIAGSDPRKDGNAAVY